VYWQASELSRKRSWFLPLRVHRALAEFHARIALTWSAIFSGHREVIETVNLLTEEMGGPRLAVSKEAGCIAQWSYEEPGMPTREGKELTKNRCKIGCS